jgi:hypothetical protein
VSKWEQHGCIDAEYRPAEEGGELMLSASDVIAYLRHHARTMRPLHLYEPGIVALADHLASQCLDATRSLVDGDQ